MTELKFVAAKTDEEWEDLFLRIFEEPMSYEVWVYLHKIKGDWIE